jgi:hypothetical protein
MAKKKPPKDKDHVHIPFPVKHFPEPPPAELPELPDPLPPPVKEEYTVKVRVTSMSNRWLNGNLFAGLEAIDEQDLSQFLRVDQELTLHCKKKLPPDEVR